MDLNYFIISPLSSLLFSFLIFGAPRGELEEGVGGLGRGEGGERKRKQEEGKKRKKKGESFVCYHMECYFVREILMPLPFFGLVHAYG